MDLLLQFENMEITYISQTLLCEDNFFSPSTRMLYVPEDIVHEIKSRDSRFSHFFSLRFTKFSPLPYIFHFSPSYDKIAPREWESRKIFPVSLRTDKWGSDPSCEHTLIIIESSAESCSGFDFRKARFGREGNETPS
jgi:hypothetical protein